VKLREIERLRGVAILMVIVVHTASTVAMFLPPVARTSWSGVDLFFVISGYVVTLSLLRLLPSMDGAATFLDAYDLAKPALKTFYIRRFFRIMPAALAVMLVNRVLTGIFPVDFGSVGSWWGEFLSFFGGIYNYAIPFHKNYKLGQYWSLSVEEHFYLFLPLLFTVFRTTNRRLGAALGVALFSIACRALLTTPAQGIENADFYERFASHLRFDSLMAGVALALVADRVKTKAVMPPRLMRFLIMPAVVALVWCLPGAAPAYVMSHVGLVALWVLSAVLVFYASQDRGYVLSFPVVGRFLEYVGARSYALYLVHVSVTHLENAERTPWPAYAKLIPNEGERPWKYSLVLLVGCFVAAEVLYRVVEQPFMRMGRRVLEGTPALSRRATHWVAVGLTLWALVYFEHPIMRAIGPRDLARGMAVYQSSRGDGAPSPDHLVNGRLEDASTHTKNEDNPWMMIDLGKVTKIGALRIYNRDDGWQDEAIPFEILESKDNEHWDVLAKRDKVFTQEWPWRIRCYDTKTRYLKFVARKNHAVLALSEVEVYSSLEMARIP
jgi:peptidoglycan/LPS O-acetylase OafA/YrhL